jgi:Dolichyl-phosphate-mannose-protein mannosyltransferase
MSIRATLAGVQRWLASMRLGALLAAIAVLALLARLALLTAEPAMPTPDTGLYAGIADRLLYGLDHEDAIPLGTVRTPGYPLMLAAVKALPGGWTDAAGAVQILLGVGVAVAIAAVAWRYFGRAAAVLAGLLAALSPLLIQAERILTPDFVFGAVLLGGAVLLAEAVLRDPPSDRLLVLSGATFGLAAYIKPSAMVLVLAGVLPLAAVTRNLRATLRGSAVLAVTATLVIVPWVARNWAVYDYPNMSSIGGVTLFLQVFDQTGLPVPTDTAEGRFVNRVRRDFLSDPANPVRTTDYAVLAALQAEGRTVEEASDVERELALNAIRRDPSPYLRKGWSNVRSLFDDLNGVSARSQLLIVSEQESVGILHAITDALSAAGRVLGDLWVELCAGGLFCLLLPFAGDRRQRAAGAALLWVWLLTAFATGYTTWPATGDIRFPAQGAPVMFVAGSAAIVFVLGAIVSVLRRGWYRAADGP